MIYTQCLKSIGVTLHLPSDDLLTSTFLFSTLSNAVDDSQSVAAQILLQ